MNINPEKVKKLVQIYSELNEEYQKELMKQAYTLQIKQTQLNQIKKEGIKFKTDNELHAEIDKRSVETAKDAMQMLEVLKKIDDTDKAAIFMLLNQLSGKGNRVKESDVAITVNQKDISMKDYLEKYLFDADYDKAKEKVIQFIRRDQEGEINE